MISKNSNALRPDAQPFDEIRIVTVPRYKTSGLSGDEWRISAKVQFFRKGELQHENGYSNIVHACGFLYSELQMAIDDGKAYFAGDSVHCDQEGCDKPFTTTYLLKKHFCSEGGEHEVSEVSQFRHFCDEHKVRGDCGLEDADRNYVMVN